MDVEPDLWKPVQIKWASGFVQGDPWEKRTVVLDEDTLPFAENKVTIGPDGAALLNSFFQRLEYTFAEAVKSRNPVLILICAHGDFETPGGLYIDTTSGSSQEILSPKMVAEVHASRVDSSHTDIFPDELPGPQLDMEVQNEESRAKQAWDI